MTHYCTRCGAPLPAASPATCPRCAGTDAAADTPIADATVPRWGIGPPALGILALAPTALLVSLLALTIPLAMATAISALALGIVQIALAWTLALRAWPPRLSPFGLSPFGLIRPARTPLKAVVATVGAIAASLAFAWLYGMAASALASRFGWNWLTPPELPGALLLPGPALIASILALVIWTPLAEEIFFRGFLMRGMVNRWGLAPGLLASAAVFAILHITPGLLLPVFVTGLLLGALYAYTRSLWPPIAVHAAQNGLAVLATALNW